MIGLVCLWMCSDAVASGVLYDGVGYASLESVDIEVRVDGRVASGTARYEFAAVAEGFTFAAAIPDNAAVSGLEVRLDGTWIQSGAEVAVGKAPGPDGALDELLPGDVFQVELPSGSGLPVEVVLTWQAVVAAREGVIDLRIPLSDSGLNPSDPQVQWSVEVAGNAALDKFEASIGTASLDGGVGTGGGAGALSTLDALELTWTEPAPLFGIDVRTYRTGVDVFTGEADPDGYALVTLLPGPVDPDARVDALYTFVLDSSASMQGRPMQTAVSAASKWLRQLKPVDRFNLVPYTSVAVPFRGRAPLATDGAVDRAIAFLERQKPAGLSDPTDGLVTGLTLLDDTVQGRGFFSCAGTANPDDGPPVRGAEIGAVDGQQIRVAPYVVWITDGGASTGQTDLDGIADHITSANAVGASVFAVGVGNNVDRDLLERVAGDHRGEVRYADRVADVPEVVAALRDRIANPVLVHPTVWVAGSTQNAPASLPDVATGTEVVLAFRYTEVGPATLQLRGLRGQRDVVERFDVLFPSEDAANPAVARVWAQLRTQDLDRRYQAGESQVYDEIEDLVRHYGVGSDVVTLGFRDGIDSYGYDVGMDASAYAKADAGCGCATPRGLAGGFPLTWVALLTLWRRRPVSRPTGP